MKQASTQLRVDCRNERNKNASWLFGSSNFACDKRARKTQHSSANNKNQKTVLRESWCKFDGTGGAFKWKTIASSSRQLTVSFAKAQKGESMGSIDVKYLPFGGWNSVLWLSPQLFLFFGYVYTQNAACCFFFQVAHRSLNRPPSAMDWFTLVTSTRWYFFRFSFMNHKAIAQG